MSPLHCPTHIRRENFRVVSEHRSRLGVERVVGVGVQKQELQSVYHGRYGKHWLPVLAENVQAYVAIQIDVRVVNLIMMNID